MKTNSFLLMLFLFSLILSLIWYLNILKLISKLGVLTKKPKSTHISTTEFIFNSSFFSFDNSFYKQIFQCSTSPLFADLALMHFEQILILHFVLLSKYVKDCYLGCPLIIFIKFLNNSTSITQDYISLWSFNQMVPLAFLTLLFKFKTKLYSLICIGNTLGHTKQYKIT